MLYQLVNRLPMTRLPVHIDSLVVHSNISYMFGENSSEIRNEMNGFSCVILAPCCNKPRKPVLSVANYLRPILPADSIAQIYVEKG